MWNLDNNLLSQSNFGRFSLTNSVVRKRLNLSKYRIPNPRIGYTKSHNIDSATKLWNTEIPIQLKQSTSLKLFKKSYKNSLISSIWCTFPSCIIELYSSLHLSQLKKTFTAYTVYLHFAAFWLVKWIEMTVTTFSELRESSLATSVIRYKQNDVVWPDGTAFLQFVADNTDQDLATIDGKKTHHGLGSIAIANGNFSGCANRKK